MFSVLGIIIKTCGFIFTWTHYAITFFVSAFRGKDYALPPMTTFFCACFAKTSVIWIPVLYISTSTQYSFHFINQQSFEQNVSVDRGNTVVANGPRLSRKINGLPANGGTNDD